MSGRRSFLRFLGMAPAAAISAPAVAQQALSDGLPLMATSHPVDPIKSQLRARLKEWNKFSSDRSDPDDYYQEYREHADMRVDCIKSYGASYRTIKKRELAMEDRRRKRTLQQRFFGHLFDAYEDDPYL